MPPVIVGEKGRYAIGASLGSGGMASVHRGLEIKTHRPVALKRLHPHLVTNAWVVSRFREEAALAGRLEHPNVAKVLDLVETAEGPVLVLERYEGGSLLALCYASWNRGEPLPQGVTSAIVLDVLAALIAAHGLTKDGAPAPVVHRDVSPHNVLFGRDGVARLADFGVARATDKTDSTETGSLRGKLSYMAPELFSGKRADPRTDLYGVGVILWELLASERLFEGEVAEVLGKMLAADRSNLTLTPRGVPSELEAVTLRALAADPAQRFKDAEVMAEALRAAAPPASRADVAAWVQKNALELPGETEIAVDEPPPSSLLETTRHPRRGATRRRNGALALGLGALLLAGGLGAAWRASAAKPETSSDLASAITTSAEESLATPSSTPPSPAPSESTSVEPNIDVSAAPAPLARAIPRPSSTLGVASTGAVAVTTSSFTYVQPSDPPPDPKLGPFNPAAKGQAAVAYYQARAECPNGPGIRVTFRPDGVVGTSMLGPDPDFCVEMGFRRRFSKIDPYTGTTESIILGFSSHSDSADPPN